MHGPMATFMGKAVFVSPLLFPHAVPCREYRPRRWVTASRQSRVQKKWTKRYGTVIRDEVIVTPSGCYMSAANFAKIKAGITANSLTFPLNAN
jgi:hypothetical protein